MDLVVDVGNSETVIGVVAPEDWSVARCWRISTKIPRTVDEFRLLMRGLLDEAREEAGDIRRVVLASVVPSTTAPLAQSLGQLLDRPTFAVTPSTPLPVTLDVDEPMTVGADRIVNTLAAKELYGRDTIAVDLGTATTFDCITADGVFVGGVIAQGLKAGIEWLGSKTAKLPFVELAPPPAVIGRRTELCMQSGVFYSAVEGIDGIVRRIKAEWGREDVLVLATGGFATQIGPYCATVERVEPFLTLQGLAIAGEHLDG